MYKSVAFSTHTVWCNHHCYLIPGHLHCPRKKSRNPAPIRGSVPFLSFSQPLAATNLLLNSTNLPILDLSYKWDHMTCTFCACPCHLARFQAPPLCSYFISFYGWTTFHCGYATFYLLISWWTSELFPLFWLLWRVLCEHLCTNFCFHTCFQFSWVHI